MTKDEARRRYTVTCSECGSVRDCADLWEAARIVNQHTADTGHTNRFMVIIDHKQAFEAAREQRAKEAGAR